MPLGPKDASKGSPEVRSDVAILHELIDKCLREKGDSFSFWITDLTRAGVKNPTDRVLEILQTTYLNLGWSKVTFEWDSIMDDDFRHVYLKCYFKRG